MSRRSRGLSTEERHLWDRVAASVRPARAHPRPETPNPGPPPASPPLAPRFSDFMVGERARPMTAVHDVVPTLDERLSSQPLQMDRRKHREMQRGKLKPEARIDLHGMTLAEAHPELIRFVLNAQARGNRLILVITGKGKARDTGGPIPQRTGILRHQVPVWLARAPLLAVVQQIAPAHVRHGGEGAIYVYLRRSG